MMFLSLLKWLVSFYNPNWDIYHDSLRDNTGEVVLGPTDTAVSHNEWTISLDDVIDVPGTVWRDSVQAGHILIDDVPESVEIARDGDPEFVNEF